jgi:glyoxylase-like metal-dependent hydrolase (beta-lactamase superfamily II)
MLRLPAGNPSPWTGPGGNNTYLLEGAVPTLIDAGVGEPAHLAALEAALDRRPLAQILVTHSHPDHVDGVPALLRRWPQVIIRNALGDSCRDGEVIAAGDGHLVAVHTPGHAPDHFCFFDPETREVYCGDLARLGGTIVIPASKGGDLRQYLDALRRIRALAPSGLLPGHGPTIDDVDGVIGEYLQHRADREQQILEILRGGPHSVEQIVGAIYTGLDPSVLRAAADSVLAHLIKLREDGLARESAAGWAAV